VDFTSARIDCAYHDFVALLRFPKNVYKSAFQAYEARTGIKIDADFMRSVNTVRYMYATQYQARHPNASLYEIPILA
jgi:hypothetical protein